VAFLHLVCIELPVNTAKNYLCEIVLVVLQNPMFELDNEEVSYGNEALADIDPPESRV